MSLRLTTLKWQCRKGKTELLIYTGSVCNTCGFCGDSCTEFMDNKSAMNLVISGGSMSKPHKSESELASYQSLLAQRLSLAVLTRGKAW